MEKLILFVHACSGASVNEARVDDADSSLLSDVATVGVECNMISTHETEVAHLTRENEVARKHLAFEGMLEQTEADVKSPKVLGDLSNQFHARTRTSALEENTHNFKNKGECLPISRCSIQIRRSISQLLANFRNRS